MDLGDDERLRRFEALVRASPDFIAIAALDGKVQYLNDAGRRLIGFPEDVETGETGITDYLTADGLRASLEVEQPAVVRDGRWSGETTLRDWRDGSGIPVDVTSFLIRDPRTEEPLALATIQRDLREVRAAAAAAAAADAALRDSERRQHALLLHMSDVLLVVDGDAVLTYVSPSTSRLLGHAEGAYLGRSMFDLVHEVDQEAARLVMVRVLATPGPDEPRLVHLLDSAGVPVLFEALADNLLAEPGVAGVVITAHDVTAARRSESVQRSQAQVLEAIASEAPLQVVLDELAHSVERQLPDVVCSVLLTEDTVPGQVLRHGASPNLPVAYRAAVDGISVALQASPCSAAVAGSVPVVVADLLAEQRWAPMHALADACRVRSCWSFPIASPASGATLGAFALYGSVPGLPDDRTIAVIDRASHLVGIAVDRQRLLVRLAEQARHDALTDLPNRVHLLEELTSALGRCAAGRGPQPVVLFIDLDRLKVINDSLGHEAGDELIVSVAGRLREAVAPGDLVARFGGDEFVVLSDAVVDQGAEAALAQRVLEVIGEPVALHGRVITPAASIGLVVAAPGQSASDVLRDADIAMYRAKHRGGAAYAVFGEDMRTQALDRLDLEGQLRTALAEGELRLHYQPVVSLRRHDEVIGFEALVRWQHPQRGLLAPADFLCLAEETGLVVPLGAWVLRTAVETMRAWSQEAVASDLTMWVNVSAQQLATPDLVDLVAECVMAGAPWSLGLELTESTLMDDSTGVLDALDQLADAGARLSIDDFGTGFSSLSYLTRMPVRRLKIDRSFVADLDRTPQAATVTAAILNLAEQLDMTVVAEGIETPHQRQRLVDMGCRYGQGYLFGRPVPEAEALALLRAVPSARRSSSTPGAEVVASETRPISGRAGTGSADSPGRSRSPGRPVSGRSAPGSR